MPKTTSHNLQAAEVKGVGRNDKGSGPELGHAARVALGEGSPRNILLRDVAGQDNVVLSGSRANTTVPSAPTI